MNKFVKVSGSILLSWAAGFVIGNTIGASEAGKRIQTNADKIFFGHKKK